MPIYKGHTRKSWPLWLLAFGAILLIALYFLFYNSPKASAPVSTPLAMESPASSASASLAPLPPLADLQVLLGSGDGRSFSGQPVNTMSATVAAVPGDKVFSVGSSPESPLYVFLPNQLDDGNAEQQVQISVGQTVHIVGTIVPIPSLSVIQSEWGLNEVQAAAAQKFGVFIEAETVQVI